MVRLKTARFMERRLGAEFAAHITGMIPAGLFVELDTMPVEGFVPREALPPGFRLTDERPAFLHDRSREEFRPGDPVRVLVAARRPASAPGRVRAGARGGPARARPARSVASGRGSPPRAEARTARSSGAPNRGRRTRKRARNEGAPAAAGGRSRSSRAKDGRLTFRQPARSEIERRRRAAGARGPRRGAPGKRGTKRR